MVFIITVALVLAGCGGSSGGSDDGCSVTEQNRFVHEDMLEYYYWYQFVPESVDYDRFDSPRQLLEYLKYAQYDRFSYIADQSEFEDLIFDGTYIGYGLSYVVESASSARIRFVYSDSPAGRVGILRGDQILSINGQDVAVIIAANSWDSVFGPDEIGLPLSIRLRRSSGQIVTLDMTKDRVRINTVLHSEVIDIGAAPNLKRVGYLVFNSFLQTSVAELDTVFANFKSNGVNRLILDLRYNGGGSVDVARRLASYIRNTTVSNSDLFIELRYNDKHMSDNFNYYFLPEPNSLGLNELTVVTTAATCSASELVISALRPYFGRVTTIGDASCGKPVGMNPINFCDKTLLAVNFASFNKNGEGDYFDGIPADCAAVDDVSRVFGDQQESMLATALQYENNTAACRAAPPLRSRPAAETYDLRAIVGAV